YLGCRSALLSSCRPDIRIVRKKYAPSASHFADTDLREKAARGRSMNSRATAALGLLHAGSNFARTFAAVSLIAEGPTLVLEIAVSTMDSSVKRAESTDH